MPGSIPAVSYQLKNTKIALNFLLKSLFEYLVALAL